MLSLIAAKAINGVIGSKGTLPWHFPKDFRWFKKITMGATLIVGRKTYESMGELPGRRLIVLSKSKRQSDHASVVYADNLQQAISIAGNSQNVFIAGGSNLYAEAMQKIDIIYLTIINKPYNGDAYFPQIPWDNFYISHYEQVEDEGINLSFIKAIRC